MGRKADVTIHIDEELSGLQNDQLCELLRGTDGVVTAKCAEHKPHLFVVEYDPDKVEAHHLLEQVSAQGWHAELIGL